jgi:hypothetical protein
VTQQKVDREEIFPSATCAVKDCLSGYSRWCRSCNLVFCGVHIDTHPCKPEDQEARKKLYLSDMTDAQDPVEETPWPPPL